MPMTFDELSSLKIGDVVTLDRRGEVCEVVGVGSMPDGPGHTKRFKALLLGGNGLETYIDETCIGAASVGGKKPKGKKPKTQAIEGLEGGNADVPTPSVDDGEQPPADLSELSEAISQ